jgi:hypothetical protein
MKKYLAETKGSFQLVDFSYRQQVVQAHRPAVITMTTFIQQHVGGDRVKLLGEVSDEATDEEFQKYWEESGDAALAVDSFLASFPVEAVSEKPAAKPAAKKAAK